MFSVQETGNRVTITLSRPPYNTLDATLAGSLRSAIEALAYRPTVHLLHLRSDQKVFCGGADLEMLRHWHSKGGAADVVAPDMDELERLNEAIEGCPCITIAEIAGAAVGAGLALALAFDLRIAANEAKFGVPEAPVGTIPAGGALRRLASVTGAGVAQRLFSTAELVRGEEAVRIGIVQWAVPRTELAARTEALISQVLANSPAALRAGKREISNPDSGGESGIMQALLVDAEASERFGNFLATRIERADG